MRDLPTDPASRNCAYLMCSRRDCLDFVTASPKGISMRWPMQCWSFSAAGAPGAGRRAVRAAPALSAFRARPFNRSARTRRRPSTRPLPLSRNLAGRPQPAAACGEAARLGTFDLVSCRYSSSTRKRRSRAGSIETPAQSRWSFTDRGPRQQQIPRRTRLQFPTGRNTAAISSKTRCTGLPKPPVSVSGSFCVIPGRWKMRWSRFLR